MSFAFGCILIWLAIVVFSSDGNPRKWAHATTEDGGAKLDRRSVSGPVFLITSIVLLALGIWLVR